MATGNRHCLYAVDVVNGGANTDLWIDQVTAEAYNGALAEIIRRAGGGVDPVFAGIVGGAPGFAFSSTAVATVMGGVGLGMKVEGDADEAGLVAYFQKMSPYGTRESGSVHTSLTMKYGLIVPSRLGVRQGDVASVDLEVASASDDLAVAPVVVSNTAALPATVNTTDELFTVGPVTTSALTVTDVTDISINFGVSVFRDQTDGYPWPRFVGIQSRQPEIRIRARHVEALTTLGIDGAAMTTWSIFLRKLEAGGTVYANNASQHLKISGYTGIVHVASVGGEFPAEAEIVIRPIYDGTHPVMAFTASQAIT